jgi:hypothetical protein
VRRPILPVTLLAASLALAGCAGRADAAWSVAAQAAPTSASTSSVASSPHSTPSVTSAPAPPSTATQGSAVTAAATSSVRSVPVAAAVNHGRYAIGDSVMLGSRSLLQARGFAVDAKVGRQFGAVVNAVIKLRNHHALPANIVVHLGTNGTIALRDCRALVDQAGPTRRVFLVNVRVPRPWTHGNNVVLDACDRSYPAARVVVINWAKAAAAHREWFGPDNVHPNAAGRKVYTQLIVDAVTRFGL